MGKHIAFALVAALSLSLAACADQPDYYEGEIIPTRPIRKPDLDPNAPAQLTGGQAPTNNVPPINQDRQPGIFFPQDHLDGRISWADDVTTSDGSTLTYLHSLNSGTGIDNVSIIDESGAVVQSFTTKYSPDQLGSVGRL